MTTKDVGTATNRRTALRLAGVGLAGVVLLTFALTAAGTLLGLTGSASPIGPDLSVLNWAKSIRDPVTQVSITVLTVLGSALPATVIGLVALVALYLRYREPLILVLVPIASIGALIISEITKAVIHRQRPPIVDALPPYAADPAFPSGHSIGNLAMAGSLAYVIVWVSPRLGTRIAAVAGALTWAGSVSFSRIYLGQHWFTDVAFGWAAGLAWLALLITTHRRALARAAAETPTEPSQESLQLA